uniref:MFS general substrate transporter n=1 Tax=Phaffia rhodozyma TaxID=264483 RepID=A0A1I9Q701_PHARH|nr:MFS general substrate transporter [Phaffia rhodozyma]
MTAAKASSLAEKRDLESGSLKAVSGSLTASNLILIFVVSLTMILNIMNNTSINVALPFIAEELGISQADLQWPVTAYALAFGCLLLLWGKLADLYGRKYAYLGGIACFCIFNIAAALSQSLIQISIFRALQGVGAAASVPAAAGIITETFPPGTRARSLAFACFSAGAPIGSGFGSIFGGVFTQYSPASWRGVFWFTAGISVIPFALGSIFIPRIRLDPTRDKRVDWLGGLLSTSGLTLLVFALSSGPSASNGWKTPYVLATLVLSILLIGAFIAWEDLLVRSSRFSLKPLMPLEIWTRGRLAVNLAVVFVGWCAFQPMLYHATLFFQDYQGLSPILTMIRFLPTAVSGIVVCLVFTLVVPYVYGWTLLTIGSLGASFAAMCMALCRPEDPYWQWAFPAMIISVFGADFIFATSSIYVSSIAKPSEQSLAAGMLQVMMQLGVAIGLAVTGVVNDAVASKSSISLGVIPDSGNSNIPKESLLEGLQAAQWTAFAFGMIGVILTVTLLRPIRVIGVRRTSKSRSASEKPDAVEDKETSERDGEKPLHSAAESTETVVISRDEIPVLGMVLNEKEGQEVKESVYYQK